MSLHVGHAGVGIGDAFWKSVCADHVIDGYDGTLLDESAADDEASTTLFDAPRPHRRVPRCVLLDTSDDIVPSILAPHRALYHRGRYV